MLDASGVAQQRFVQGPGIDEPLVAYSGNTPYFYHADGLGSVISITDSTGALAAAYAYDSFGVPTQTGGATTTQFRYTGRQWDQETGLYYYRARYYAPSLGRFLSEDPVRYKGGGNFYRYVSNNPVNLIDPPGLGTSGAVIGGVLGTVIGGVLGGTIGVGAGAASGTLVAPGVGTIGAGIAGGAEGATVGAATGGVLGAAIGNALERILFKVPAVSSTCRRGQVECWFSGELKDPTVDARFKMCSYSCSDGKARVAVIHVVLPCPRDPSRIPGFYDK